MFLCGLFIGLPEMLRMNSHEILGSSKGQAIID